MIHNLFRILSMVVTEKDNQVIDVAQVEINNMYQLLTQKYNFYILIKTALSY